MGDQTETSLTESSSLSSQTESNETNEAAVNTQFDLDLLEQRLDRCTRRENDLQVQNREAQLAHRDLQRQHGIAVNDRLAVTEAFNKLKGEFQKMKNDRNHLREEIEEAAIDKSDGANGFYVTSCGRRMNSCRTGSLLRSMR